MKSLMVLFFLLISPFLVSAQIDSQDVFRIQNVDINFSTLTLDTMNIEAGLHYLNFTIGNISIIPSDTGNYTNVTIKTWNTTADCLVSSNESSTNHTNTAVHTITNPCWSNKLISVNKNSIPWNTYLADSSGLISFNYTDGYSDVQFDMQPTTTTSITNLIGTPQRELITWSWLNPIDANYAYSSIFIDYSFVLNSTQTAYVLPISRYSTHTISIQTVGTDGIMNSTVVSDTQTSYDAYSTTQWSKGESGSSLWGSLGTIIKTAVIISVIVVLFLFLTLKNIHLSMIEFIGVMGAIVIIIVFFIVIPMIGYSLESGMT